MLHTYYGEPNPKLKVRVPTEDGKGTEDISVAELQQRGFESRDEGGIDNLPWIIRNDLALHHFLKNDFGESVKALKEANKMILGNVVFMYRWGVCLEAMAAQPLYKQNVPRWQKAVSKAISLYEGALARIEKPQSQLTILMQLADAYEVIGKKSKAASLWRRVKEIDPTCYEAQEKAKGYLALENVGGGLRKLLSFFPSRGRGHDKT